MPEHAVASATTARIPTVAGRGAHAVGGGASRRVRWSRRLVVLLAVVGVLAGIIVAACAPADPSGAARPADPVPAPLTPDATRYTPPNAVVEVPPTPSPAPARSTAPSDRADR